jgi:hypothetical protein
MCSIWVESLKILQTVKRRAVDDAMQKPLYNLAQNQKAAIEWETLNQQLSRTSEQYVFDTENHMGMGTDVLIPRKYRDAFKAAKKVNLLIFLNSKQAPQNTLSLRIGKHWKL